MMLTQDELRRYNRHVILPEFGQHRQELLKTSRVLVIGAGGLGCPILLYLTNAGIGHITIIDADTIDISNLQRQVLYAHEDIGKPKAQTAAQKLQALNPFITISYITDTLHKGNALDLIASHDVIIDGSDNFPTRYLVNDACVIAQKPLVFGSIFKFEGQVSVFNYKGGPTYRCIYPEPPQANEVPSCSEIGVLGILPGIIGVLQATEAIKLITGIGEPLSGRLLLYDALSNQQSIINVTKNESIVVKDLLDNYDAFCGIEASTAPLEEELTPAQAITLLKNNKVQIIDVREQWEYDICRLEGSTLIPLKTIPNNSQIIAQDKPTLLYCHHGIRSRHALEYLKQKGYKQLYHLKGGIDQWALVVDQQMERY
ncbi:MAG TPA: molybdopterin-synthase adenylyltransferase MoeB [Cytophagales bacterium]|nr:molybdopterin-synthase adenylyltransferase MoeB [Cytophagales bacterium]